MTVIGSVEFEASLSLDKFNKDLNNLIAKNKALTLPINAVLNFDAKNQISKVSKTGLPTLKVKVDDKELTRLNQHLELKRKHHREVQQYFNSNPLTVKVNNREIDKSIQKVKELRTEIGLLKQNLGGAGGSKIVVEHRFPTQPGGGSGGVAVVASISRSSASIAAAINHSSSSIQSTILVGSSVVQNRVSMNTVIISSNIRKTNSLLESLGKTLPDLIGKSVKRYSKDGLITSLIKAPFKMAGGAIGSAASSVGAGFFLNIGGSISTGFGAGKAAEEASKKVKHYMKLTDEYLIGGVDNFMAAFLAELTRSGNFNKAVETAMPQLRLMKEYAPKFEKMMQLSGLMDSIKRGEDVPDDIKKLLVKQVYADRKTGEVKQVWSSMADLEKSIETLKKSPSNKWASANFSKALFDPKYGLLEGMNPQDLIQGYVNPVLKELSAITSFIGKIQQHKAIIGAKGKMAGVKALLPMLEEGQKGYLQVIGGAVGREGKGGGYKLESYLEPLARERKIIPVHNPDTDPAGIEDRDPFLASVLEIAKGMAPEIFANKELYNTLLNGITLATQTVNPMFQSQAVTDALANILVALENGVAPEDISTVSYSLGGKEARALADALHILGIEVKTLALGYPEINASQTDVPNFVATQIVEDGLGFVKNVLRIGGQQNMKVYEGGVSPGPEAHAPKHYFKNKQQIADFFTDLNLNIPDVSDTSAFSKYMTMVENFTEQISGYYQALSLAATGDLDPTKSIEGTGQKAEDVITGVLEATYKKQSFKSEGAPGKGSTPEMQAISKKMIELQNRAYDALEKKLVSLGLKQPVGETREARAGELFGQIKLRAEFENGLKPFLDSLESGVVQQNQHGENSWWAADFDPQKMMMRSVDAVNAAIYFKGEGALEDKDYTEAIVKVFENIRKIAVEYYKSQGKITPEIKKLIDEARNSPLLDTVSTPAQKEYYEMFRKKIEGDDIVSRKDQREFTIPTPNWLKKSPSSAIAYNQLLADVGSEGYVPPIEEVKAVGYGMSGAASFIGEEHVYKNEPGNPQAVASQREVDAYKKLAGRYSPLMYAATPGKALVVERVKGKPVKDILDELAAPVKKSQEQLAKLRDLLANEKDAGKREKLTQEIAKETTNFKKYKSAFNKEATYIYEQIGRLGKTMINMGVAHGDLASANVFRLDDGTFTSIDLGNAIVNPDTIAKVQDQMTTIQRALIDRAFWGILDPVKISQAIIKGYSGTPFPDQQERTASVDDLPKYQDVSPIPLGSEQKGLLEEYLNYKELAQQIRENETEEIKKAREELVKILSTQQTPEAVEEALSEWEKTAGKIQPPEEERVYKKEPPTPSYSPLVPTGFESEAGLKKELGRLLAENQEIKIPDFKQGAKTNETQEVKKVQQQVKKSQQNLRQSIQLSAKEIDSIAHDLKTYFHPSTLKATLEKSGITPAGKNIRDYAKQVAENFGVDAFSLAYKTGGVLGLSATGRLKEQSLTRERLLEDKGYQILRGLYVKLKQQLQQKEKELKQIIKAINSTGEKVLEQDLKAISSKALEVSGAVKQTVAEIEVIKENYNIPQSVGQNISGMVDALKSYGIRSEKIAQEFTQGTTALDQIALPELKLSDYENQFQHAEIPDQLKGINPNQQMLGIGALGALFGGQGILGSLAIAPISIPIAFTLAGGAGAIAAGRVIQPFLQKNAPNLAKILYLNVNQALTGFGRSLQSYFNKLKPGKSPVPPPQSGQRGFNPIPVGGLAAARALNQTSLSQKIVGNVNQVIIGFGNQIQSFFNGLTLNNIPFKATSQGIISNLNNSAKGFGNQIQGFFNGIFARFKKSVPQPVPPQPIPQSSMPAVFNPKAAMVIQGSSPHPVTFNPVPVGGLPTAQTPSVPIMGLPPQSSMPAVFNPNAGLPPQSSMPAVFNPNAGLPPQSSMPAVFNPKAIQTNTAKAAKAVSTSVATIKKEYSTLRGVIKQLSESIPAPLRPLVEQIQRIGKAFLFGRVFEFIADKLRSTARETFAVTARFQGLEKTINFLSGGTRAGARQMEFLRGEIIRTSSAIEPALQGYKKLAASTRGTSMEGKQTNQMTSALMQASRVFGLSGEELEGSILAISQIAGKGTVSMEELRGQLAERIPGAFQMAARSMDITEQQLYKLISLGELASVDFLPKLARQLSAETAGGVGGASNSATAALVRLRNSLTDMQVAAGKEFQGVIVFGMNAINVVLESAVKHTGTFIEILKIAAGVAVYYAAPAMWAFVKGLWQIPLASVAAKMAVNGLKDAIMTLIVPTVTQFASTVAVVWLAVEAFKVLAGVWDAFVSRTQSQVWSETLSKNLKKNRQDVKDLWKEIEKTNRINTPRKPGEKPETASSLFYKELNKKRASMGMADRFLYQFGGEFQKDQLKELEALKQTIKDEREVKTLQRDRVSGALKDFKDTIDSSSTQENIKRLKDYNAQIEQLRQKASLATDPGSQRQIKDQIEQLRELRDVYGNDLVYGMTEVNIQIENRQKAIKETDDDRKREELKKDLIELEAMKKKLQEIERQTGAQTTLSELMQLLARIRVEMEMFNRVAQEVADKGLRRIAEIELKGLRTDIFASADAALKRSENALELVRNKINISTNTIKELKALLKDPMMGQYAEFYGDKSLEQLRVDLEGVDEKEAERRTALEALILLREQESNLIGLQREQAEGLVSLEKERSQAVLSRLDQFKTRAQSQGQIQEAQELARIAKKQLDRRINSEEAEVLKSEVSLGLARRNQKLVEIELTTIKKYFKDGKITAEDFANRRRELEVQVAQGNQQILEQELQLRQAIQQKVLDSLDREIQKLDHLLKLREAITQIGQKDSQIKGEKIGTQKELSILSQLRDIDPRTRAGEDIQTQLTRQRERIKLNLSRQTEDETLAVQKQTTLNDQAKLQRSLFDLKSYYQKGEIGKREYEDRSRQIEKDLSAGNVQIKDYELQETQRLNQRQVEDFERINQQIAEDRTRFNQRMVEDFERAVKAQENTLQLSAIRQEQIIRQKQLGQIDLIGSQKAEQQAAIALAKIQEEQTKKQLKDTLEQIKQVAELRRKNALTEWEAKDRTADLAIKAEQLRLDLINKQIEKARQLKDLKILDLDNELTQIDTIFQKQEMGLNYELEKRKQIVDSLDRAKSVLESQLRLQQALMKGEEQQRQAALDRSRDAEDLLGRLPDLQKRANDNSINFREYKGTRYLMDLVRQMARASSGSTFLSESDIVDLRTKQYNQSVTEERKLLEMKTRHLEQQQKIQLAQTELQKRMNRLTAENAILEANISLNKARQAELQAKIALEKARINGDPREIQNAQSAYDLAKQGTQLSQMQVENAIERLTTSNQVSKLDQQALNAEQANERFSLQEANRKALQETALRGGELASQGAINVDSMIKADSKAIKFDLSPITPVVDITSQINTKLDALFTAISGVFAKPSAPSIENLTVVSSDPTGDSRQILDDMTRAKNMYY